MQNIKSELLIKKDIYFYAGVFASLILLIVLVIAGITDAVGAAVYWIAGIAFGVTVQRSRFCFTSAFRDYFLLGQTRILKGILVGLAIATVGFALVMSTVVPNPGFGAAPSDANVLPVGASTLIAGTLFGIGMVLAGGCVSGSLYRMGEGYIGSWLAIGGVLIGLFFLNNTWNWWWDNLISNESLVWLPKHLTYTWSLVATLGILVVILYLAIWRERRAMGGFIMPSIRKRESTNVPHSSFGELTGYFKKLMTTEWNPIWAGAILGLINLLLFVRFHPMGVVGEISRWSTSISKMVGFPELQLRGLEGLGACVMVVAEGSWFTEGFFFNFGIIAGSATSSLISREFKIRIPQSPMRYIQSIVGGVIMGYGAGLGVGCTLGAFFSSVPSLALNGWVYAIGLCVGSFLAVQWIKRFP
ncbi:MAG: hypothetical protein CL781_01640 [Chloroflexi bacterium]|nr:hypothetical protein [Chloroflexota bacterium]